MLLLTLRYIYIYINQFLRCLLVGGAEMEQNEHSYGKHQFSCLVPTYKMRTKIMSCSMGIVTLLSQLIDNGKVARNEILLLTVNKR